MKRVNGSIWLLGLFLIQTNCDKSVEDKLDAVVTKQEVLEMEKKAILNRLNTETKNAFERNYEAWKDNWLQDSNISKTYINFVDSTFSESIGWKDISSFVQKFIEDHPAPEPVPEKLKEIDLRLYGSGAWVTYEQVDSVRGLKRETRLMEKVDGQWKIAGMHTTIYGFD